MRRSRRIRVLGSGGPLVGVAKDRVRWVSGVKCLGGCRRESLPYKHFLVTEEGVQTAQCATSSSSKLVRVFTSRAHQYIPALFILTKIA